MSISRRSLIGGLAAAPALTALAACGGSGGGSSMPRTGAELTGLTAGALLILGGGAAIGLARRKNKS